SRNEITRVAILHNSPRGSTNSDPRRAVGDRASWPLSLGLNGDAMRAYHPNIARSAANPTRPIKSRQSAWRERASTLLSAALEMTTCLPSASWRSGFESGLGESDLSAESLGENQLIHPKCRRE